jgi:deoxyribodipyrimidine photo-lyase
MVQIVWFKRDLRIRDHKPLFVASQEGPIIPLYIFEPTLWKGRDLSYRHYSFLKDSLEELKEDLKALGLDLVIRVGEAVDVLNELSEKYEIKGLWSHQETWNNWTYQRDKLVQKWAKDKNIPWQQYDQNGVIRSLKNRDGWAENWMNRMKMPVIPHPHFVKPVKNIPSDCLPCFREMNLQTHGWDNCQKGGRKEGLKTLYSFLNERGFGYGKEMSSPLTAYNSCSRLSPFLAFGNISMKEVFQETQRRLRDLKNYPYDIRQKWVQSLNAFLKRLVWHCHFIQKLEDQPDIEFKNMHSSYNILRHDCFKENHFQAWCEGRTGYPMIDASMRALRSTGWLNFRMRAMLMSFASYHLWLDWREPALYLAQLFIDYEPGIHYSQVQMQSGTTGINAVRIYNPIKQGLDHDPQGLFIKEWIPELHLMPVSSIHTPWRIPSLMNGYPHPIVDEKKAREEAASKIYGLRQNNPLHQEEARSIVHKHGSRGSGLSSSKMRTQKKISPSSKIKQMELFP